MFDNYGKVLLKMDAIEKDLKKITERIDELENYGKSEHEAIRKPQEQEKWIVHRTLRTKNKEIYIGTNNVEFTQVWLPAFLSYPIPSTYEKESAYKYNFNEAVRLRDKLNETRKGKQYLWVISKMEN